MAILTNMPYAPILSAILVLCAQPSASIAAALGRNLTNSWSYVIESDDDSIHPYDAGMALKERFSGINLTSDSHDTTSLLPIGPFLKNKTILLIEGEASDTVSFRLSLAEGEKLEKVYHLVDNPDVITNQTHLTQEISSVPTVYNISLSHYFERNVGIASYLLHVTVRDKDGKPKKLMQTGTYVVSGIIAKRPSNATDPASGMLSEALFFQDPESVSLGAGIGQIPLELEYQPLGPDITENPLPLEKVITTAQITVKNMGSRDDIPLLTFDPNACNSVQLVEKDKDGAFVFEETNCGIGFDISAGLLVLNLNQNRDGNIEVNIVLPTLIANGEVFETSIQVSVGITNSPKPVVIVPKPFTLVLDYYGCEEFSLLMYNTIKPAQKANAIEYYVDFPSERYAEIDFNKSSLVNPTQVVSFKTLPPGKGSSIVWKRIQNAIEFNSMPEKAQGTIEIEPTPTAEALEEDIIEVSKSLNLTDAPNATNLYGIEVVPGSMASGISESLLTLDVKSVTEDSAYTSGVHVGFPDIEDLVTAVNNYNNPIYTSFASSALAKKEGVENDALIEHVEVKVVITEYSTFNFSEFKNQQIKMSLLAHALKKEKGTRGEARLFDIAELKDGLLLTYDLQVSGNSSEIAKKLGEDKELTQKLAKDARLADDRVSSVSAKSVKSRESQNSVGGTTLSGTVSAALIISIVALVLILSIPLFILLLGFIATRRYQAQNAEEQNQDVPQTSPVPAETGLDSQNLENVTPASHIARDTFGRAQEDQEQESYKMERELFREGYFGDNPGQSQSQQQ